MYLALTSLNLIDFEHSLVSFIPPWSDVTWQKKSKPWDRRCICFLDKCPNYRRKCQRPSLLTLLTHWLPCWPWRAFAFSSISDVNTFDQIWHQYILNFCRRKRSLQWYPDLSDRLNGAWNIHENAQKFEWRTPSKISRDYTRSTLRWKLPVSMMLSRKFLNRKQAQFKVITAAKR